MSNTWIDNALTSAQPDAACVPAPLADAVDVGGPMGLLVEPCDNLPATAAYYDQESDVLAVHILPFEPYHSFLEAGDIRIDTDASGRPVYLEAAQSRAKWRIDPQLSLPAVQATGTFRFRNTRRIHSPGEIWANPCRDTVCLRFLARRDGQIVRFSEHVLAEFADDFLVALWISGIELDFGERKQAEWRARMAAQLRKTGREWRPCTRGKLSKSLSKLK